MLAVLGGPAMQHLDLADAWIDWAQPNQGTRPR